MEMLIDGISPKEIAFLMKISNKTFYVHKNNLYRKLNIHSIQELFAKNPSKKRPVNNISEENPMIAVLYDDGNFGWKFKYNSLQPFYEEKIEAGDRFTVNLTFTSNVKINDLLVSLVDNTVKEDGYWTDLSCFLHFRCDVKPHIEYTDSFTLITTVSASSANPKANTLVIMANIDTEEQPVLTFTRFKIIQTFRDKKPLQNISKKNPMIIHSINAGLAGKKYLTYRCNLLPPFYGDKIKAGDDFTIHFTFTSNIKLNSLKCFFYDDLVEKGDALLDEGCYSLAILSEHYELMKNIKPNIEYKSKTSITASKTASTTRPKSNILVIVVYYEAPELLSLEFTRFDVNKVKK